MNIPHKIQKIFNLGFPMALKAVLFDFNGVIINDEKTHEKLIEQLLLEENLRIAPGEFQRYCVGRSDRAALKDLLENRGRFVSETYLLDLIKRKEKAYFKELESLEKLPTYPGLEDLIFRLQGLQCKLAVVSGALKSEIELVLERLNLRSSFSVIVAGDDITTSKPEPDGYLLGIERLKAAFPELDLKAQDCLAIEDTAAGLKAARSAGIRVVGIANTYPFHMMQRWSNWAVDYFMDLELDRIQELYNRAA
jgi:beta-phosphoglucomutase